MHMQLQLILLEVPVNVTHKLVRVWICNQRANSVQLILSLKYVDDSLDMQLNGYIHAPFLLEASVKITHRLTSLRHSTTYE